MTTRDALAEEGWSALGDPQPLGALAGIPILRHWGVERGQGVRVRDGGTVRVLIHPLDLPHIVAATGQISRALDLLTQALDDWIRTAPTPLFEEALLAFDRGQIERNERVIEVLRKLGEQN